MYFIQRTLTSNQTIIPNLIWIFNTFFLAFLYLAFIFYSKSKIIEKITILIFFIISSVFVGINYLYVNLVYWNDGAVLVYYVNKTGELYDSILVIIMVILLCIHSISMIFNEKKSKEIFFQKMQFFLAFLILVLALFIPRTYSYSITNAFSVKIIGYIFYYLFILILFYAIYSPTKIVNLSSNILNFNFLKKHIDNFNLLVNSNLENVDEIINLSIYSVLILFILALMDKFGPNLVPISVAESNKLGLSIFLFTFNMSDYYIHVLGGLAPLLFTVILFSYFVVRKKLTKLFILKITFIIVFGVLLSLALNIVLRLSLETYHGTYQFLLGFTLSPIILLLYNLTHLQNLSPFDDLKLKSENFSNVKSLFNSLINPGEVYIGTFLSLFIFDIIQPPSSTGVYLIGGGGFADGLLLLPIGIISAFYLILSFSIVFLAEIKKKVLFFNSQA